MVLRPTLTIFLISILSSFMKSAPDIFVYFVESPKNPTNIVGVRPQNRVFFNKARQLYTHYSRDLQIIGWDSTFGTRCWSHGPGPPT